MRIYTVKCYQFILMLHFVLNEINIVLTEHRNVLFIAVDDLRPELGFYIDHLPHKLFNPKIKTPNLDFLASRSAVFTRAFAQYPLCNPSRSSFLTGRYPRTTKVLENYQVYEKLRTNLTAIPLFFKRAGYTTISEGKIFHYLGNGNRGSYWNREISSRLRKSYTKKRMHLPEDFSQKSWNIVPLSNNSNELYKGEEAASKVAHILRKIQEDEELRNKPYFIAAGFETSHYPFHAPQKFFDYYRTEDVHLATNDYNPKNRPKSACCNDCPLTRFSDISRKTYNSKRNPAAMDSVKALELRRAYYSAISYLDYNVGIILQALKDTKQLDNTIIVFVADHGLSLGKFINVKLNFSFYHR